MRLQDLHDGRVYATVGHAVPRTSGREFRATGDGPSSHSGIRRAPGATADHVPV